jgi:hypothetical protein
MIKHEAKCCLFRKERENEERERKGLKEGRKHATEM